MDIVLPLNNASAWQNNELKYTLRGIEKYLSGVDRLFIVGDAPAGFKDYIHIPFADNPNLRDENIKNKIVAACNDSRVSEHFICFSDDHFLLHPYDAEAFPFYAHGTLMQLYYRQAPEASYRVTVMATIDMLNQFRKMTFNYNIHAPIVYNKKLFIETMRLFKWQPPYGMVIKSLYCNYNSAINKFKVELPDMKIKQPHSMNELLHIIKGRPLFSIGDSAICADLEQFMNMQYPVKSRWEV